MTASITHCCRSLRALAERARALLLALLIATLAGHASAAGVTMRDVRLDHGDDGYQLSTDVSIALSPRLAEAVTRGVALYFVLEFEISRPRW